MATKKYKHNHSANEKTTYDDNMSYTCDNVLGTNVGLDWTGLIPDQSSSGFPIENVRHNLENFSCTCAMPDAFNVAVIEILI